MNALIVDDEKPNRDGLRKLLELHCPEVSVAGEAASVQSARMYLAEKAADILFLDVNMPNENGFDLLASLPGKNVAVVFVTAYSEYAVRAFKANAVDYVLKPIDIDDLKTSVKKCRERLNQLDQNGTAEVYKHSLQNAASDFDRKEYPQKLTLPHLQGFHIIETMQIMHLEADGNYTMIYLNTKEKLLVTRALGEFAQILDPNIFFRAHKSAMINLGFVKEYSSKEGHFAVMLDNSHVIISRRRLDEFMEAIGRHSIRM